MWRLYASLNVDQHQVGVVGWGGVGCCVWGCELERCTLSVFINFFPHSQLNKKRELEGQIEDLKSDLAPLESEFESILTKSKRQTNGLLWLG